MASLYAFLCVGECGQPKCQIALRVHITVEPDLEGGERRYEDYTKYRNLHELVLLSLATVIRGTPQWGVYHGLAKNNL